MTEEEKRLQAQQTAPAAQPQQAAQPAPQQTPQQTTVTNDTVNNKNLNQNTSTVKVTDEAYNNALATLKAGEKPTYAGTYDAQLNDIYDQIVNREKFSYDLNADALYQQYRDQYVNLGQMAMRDSMGQAAALTGGYGSSYGQSVGQQQYDAYLQQLNDVVPELYGMAYDRYQGEGDALMNQYAMTGDLAADEYGKYQDALNQYWQERDYNYATLMDMMNNTGYVPTADEIAAAGMTQAQVDDFLKSWKVKNPDLAYRTGKITADQYKAYTGVYPAGYAAPGSGGGGWYGGGKFEQDILDLQIMMNDLMGTNIAEDGIRGNETNKTADSFEKWEAENKAAVTQYKKEHGITW